MDLVTSMKLFHSTVNSGSFSDTGRQFGLAPSSVSRQISTLEDHLKVQLFNRSTRQLHLTEAGEIYYKKVGEILHLVEDAEAAVTELQDTPRGLLHLNVPIAFGRRKVSPLLPEFMKRYPEIEIEMTMTDTLINVIEEGADVAIRIGELGDSSLIARKLAPNRRAVAASPAYLEQFGVPKVPQDLLQGHSFITYRRQKRDEVWHFHGPNGGDHHIDKVLGRLNPEAPHDVVLVLDATNGQNALSQIDVFKEVAGVTGLIMTKLDGTARGGVLVAAAEQYGLPIHAIGVGEKIDDLRPFDPELVAKVIAGVA